MEIKKMLQSFFSPKVQTWNHPILSLVLNGDNPHNCNHTGLRRTTVQIIAVQQTSHVLPQMFLLLFVNFSQSRCARLIPKGYSQLSTYPESEDSVKTTELSNN